VMLGNGNGTFQAGQTFDSGPIPTGMALTDINGDGTLDVVLANDFSSVVDVLLGNGNGIAPSKLAKGE